MTTSDHQAMLQAARAYAEKAASLAASLEPGGHDAVQALALTSIAHSLAAMASLARRD